MSTIHIVGDCSVQLWGLSIREWQSRAYKKIGVGISDDASSRLHLEINWVLSPTLIKAFAASRKTLLVATDNGQDIVIGVSDMTSDRVLAMIGHPVQDTPGFSIARPDDLAGSYNKALRRREAPYALNVETTPIREILGRQSASSYRGNTDFVTKFAWPIPAYYATRFFAALKITPNTVTTLSLCMVFVAMFLFAAGQWALGFMAGWFMTFLDTVDGNWPERR